MRARRGAEAQRCVACPIQAVSDLRADEGPGRGCRRLGHTLGGRATWAPFDGAGTS